MDIGGDKVLKVYDKNGNYIRGIVDYKDARIEQELNITDTLLFNIPKSLGDIFEEEGYVETKEDGRFVIKEKNLTNDGYEIVGKYDLEELLEWVESESYVTMNIIDMFNDLLEGTGWQIKYGDEWGRNLLRNSDFVNGIENWTGNQNVSLSIVDKNLKVIFNQETSTPGVKTLKNLILPTGTYTISAKVKGSYQGLKFTFYAGRSSLPGKYKELTGEWEVVTRTVDLKEPLDHQFCMLTSGQTLGSYFLIDWIKIEKGSQATPWTPAPEDLTLPKRTVTGTNMSILEFLYKAVDTFKYDIRFDNITKTIYVADELGADKGVYFHDEVNLKSLNTTSDTYDFATRLIPVGFNGMGIELINDGKSYVENHTYSDKIVTVYWQDERYTVMENLKADAEKKLAKICKPLRSYSAEVQDLSRSKDYKILSYEVGDTITLVDKDANTKEKQRIIKKVKYLDEPEKDSVVIANRPRYLGDEQEKIVENLRNSFNITKASLELFEDSIVGKVSEIEGVITNLEDDYDNFKGDVDARITDNTAEIEVLATEVSSKVSKTEYDRDYQEINDSYTEFRQDFESFKNTIQIGGGNNLIKNSVGYGGLNYWDGELDYGTSTWILEGTAKHGWIGSSGAIEQEVVLLPNTDYTLSGRLKKATQAGTVTIGLYDNGNLIHEAISKGSEIFDGKFSLQFNTENMTAYTLKVIIQDASTVDPVEITDLMLAQGQNYDIWSQASGEIYTLNVKMDAYGVTVYNADGKGKTVMSPEEFAGYYNNQRIFTLNGDITEVMGLYVGGKGLFIPPVKFVQTQSSLDVVWTGR